MRNLKKLAFTLIELLVVISIIGILAALAIPAVAGALVKGQLTGTLNNARQLQLATFNMNLENESAGIEGLWPGTGTNTYANWISSLTNAKVLSESDLRKMLSAPGVAAKPPFNNADNEIAFFVYPVGTNNGDSSWFFLTTRNLNAPANSTANPTVLPALSTTMKPYGDKGAVVMRMGGDGQVLTARFVTNTNVIGSPAGQPAKM